MLSLWHCHLLWSKRARATNLKVCAVQKKKLVSFTRALYAARLGWATSVGVTYILFDISWERYRYMRCAGHHFYLLGLSEVGKVNTIAFRAVYLYAKARLIEWVIVYEIRKAYVGCFLVETIYRLLVVWTSDKLEGKWIASFVGCVYLRFSYFLYIELNDEGMRINLISIFFIFRSSLRYVCIRAIQR